jgi:hypothetical protein
MCSLATPPARDESQRRKQSAEHTDRRLLLGLGSRAASAARVAA